MNQQAKQRSGGDRSEKWVWILTLPFTKGMSLGTGCPVPEPPCPHLDNIKEW